MATITEEKFLLTATVLTQDESASLEAVLGADPEPVNGDMVDAFQAAAHKVKVD
jgi:hypothetical protein